MQTYMFDALPYIVNELGGQHRSTSNKISISNLLFFIHSNFRCELFRWHFHCRHVNCRFWNGIKLHVTCGTQYASTFGQNEIWMDFILAMLSHSFNARFANFRSLSLAQLDVIVKVLFYCALSLQNTLLILLHSFGRCLLCANALRWLETKLTSPLYAFIWWETIKELIQK